MKSNLRKVTKEEWERLRQEVVSAARKIRIFSEDMNWYYAKQQVECPDVKSRECVRGANFRYPKGYTKWIIRHFSPVGCRPPVGQFPTTPVTCLLRSPDGRHYTAEHLPGFCPIHGLIPVCNKKETK